MVSCCRGTAVQPEVCEQKPWQATAGPLQPWEKGRSSGTLTHRLVLAVPLAQPRSTGPCSQALKLAAGTVGRVVLRFGLGREVERARAAPCSADLCEPVSQAPWVFFLNSPRFCASELPGLATSPRAQRPRGQPGSHRKGSRQLSG